MGELKAVRDPEVVEKEVDILIVGGGMAACGTAFEVKKWIGDDQTVLLCDKAAMERSGAVAQGLSAINTYIGDNTPDDYVRMVRNDLMGLVREDLIFDPLHYLALIERKIGALDQAAPLAGWDLPQAFTTLRRLLEARMGKAGKREYVQVLRLLESFRLDDVEGAVGDALRLGAIGFDAVKHLVLCRIERRPPRLNLDIYPYLPRAEVATTSAESYMSLLSGAER